MTTKNNLFEDMSIALRLWTEGAMESITDKNADLMWTDNEASFRKLQKALAQQGVSKEDVKQVFFECLSGYAVSFLVMLDGGTSLAESGRIFLVDEDGNHLGEGLHEEFLGYLLEKGDIE